MLLRGATAAGRHEARVCIIISSSVVLLCRSVFVSRRLFPCLPRIIALQLLSQRTPAGLQLTSTALHTASRHICSGKVSISWAAPFFAVYRAAPSIDFLPSLCHNCLPLVPLPARATGQAASVCCLTPYGLLRRYGTGTGCKSPTQCPWADLACPQSSYSRFCIHSPSSLAALAICGAYLHLHIALSLISLLLLSN